MQNKSLMCDDTLQINKYEPHKVANGKNDATFFVVSDEIDLADLQRYRQQTQTDYLIAINGSEKNYDCLKLADNVITCLPNEIELAMLGFKSLVLGGGLIGFDWNDIRTAIHKRKHIQFIQGYATDKNYVANACEKLIAKLYAIENDFPLKAVMVNTLADDGFGFDQLDFITKRLEENLNIDEANIFYQVNFLEASDFWEKGEHGCCICMFLVYSDEKTEPNLAYIENNTAEKTTNSIQEYLRRQQKRSNNE